MGHDAADHQRLLQPDVQRSGVPGGHPAAALLRSRRRPRGQLRRHRRGDRPRDGARLRRSGREVRRPRGAARVVAAGGYGGLQEARRPAGGTVRRVRRAARTERQRPPDARREHRRPGGPLGRLRRLPPLAERRGAAGARRPDGRPEVLPLVRADLAFALPRAAAALAGAEQSAQPAEIPRQRRGAQRRRLVCRVRRAAARQALSARGRARTDLVKSGLPVDEVLAPLAAALGARGAAVLEGVAALIFDEFHERSLQADLGLALSLDAREHLAPELRLLVMSATLDGAAVASLLGDAPRVSAPGRLHPVETRYAGSGPPALPDAAGAGAQHAPERLVSQLILRALREQRGDVLAFLPGAREIRRVHSSLAAAQLPAGVQVMPLFGDLPGEQQDAALAPAPAGARKVVLATNIAETSLTIPGVRVVVDSGLARRASFDPVSGMSLLTTRRISRASADQRRGRAGRLEPGVCYRAWSEGAHPSLAPYTPPEIVDADLAPLALELASWGGRDAAALRWLDAPPAAQLASARQLLERLGALDDGGRITAHGREMARLGAHPRLAHMLLRARSLGQLPLAAQLAALLPERDLLRGGLAASDADIRTRPQIPPAEEGAPGTDRPALQRARRAARDLEWQAGGQSAGGRDQSSVGDAGPLLAFAYPDRIGRARAGGDGRFALANGRGAAFGSPQGLARRELIVAVDLDDRERDARILLAAPLERRDLSEHFAERLRWRESVHWSAREQAVIAQRTLELDALTLEEKPLAEVPAEAARRAMLAGVTELGIEALPS